MALPHPVQARIAAMAADRHSGASEILDRALRLLDDMVSTTGPVCLVAQELCRAQPSMAPIWNAALAAVASIDDPNEWPRFVARVAKAPAALTRVAVDLLALTREDRPLTVATFSYSGSVLRIIEALSRERPVRVACAEGRPAYEGRRLAAYLAAQQIPVSFFTDSAIGEALPAVEAVLLGADAVTATWFLNKVGTRMLAATAGERTVPVYVAASREKFVSHELSTRLNVRAQPADEVWERPPEYVTVHNPYFERTPVELVTSFITDIGVLAPTMVRELCARDDTALLAALEATS